jgi:uncharacterized protein
MSVSAEHAGWRHQGARDGFEVVFVREAADGRLFEGAVAAVEDGNPWVVRYAIVADESWTTRSARITRSSADAEWSLHLEADGMGGWRIDSEGAPHLEGCLDVDLEASVFTNALPIRRLLPAVGATFDAPAAYVRVSAPVVERLEQRYTRLDVRRYDYSAPAFAFRAVLRYDDDGLIADYPGIAARVS